MGLHCNCPAGMKYHAINCPYKPGEEQHVNFEEVKVTKQKQKVFELGMQLHTYPKGSVVVKDVWGWRVGPDSYDTRGSIWEGEFALLLDYLERTNATSILKPLDSEDTE